MYMQPPDAPEDTREPGDIIDDLKDRLATANATISMQAEALKHAQEILLSEYTQCPHEDNLFHHECPVCSTCVEVKQALSASAESVAAWEARKQAQWNEESNSLIGQQDIQIGLLKQRAEKSEADAKRYQWLRNEVTDWYVGPSYATYNDVVCEGEYNDLSAGGIALDTAIDAAMNKEPK